VARLWRRWGLWPVLVAALVLLDVSLTFENVWPTPKIRPAWALSVELALCVALLAATRGRLRALLQRVLPVAWVVLVAGHYLDVTAPGLYGREFNLYWDSRHLGNVTAMLARAAPWWLVAGAVLGLVLIVGAVFVLARLAFATLAAASDRRAMRGGLLAASAIVIALFAVQAAAAVGPLVPFADPVAPAYARQARFVLATLGPAPVAPALGPSPDLRSSFAALGGADVLVVFIESYGAVTYDTPEIARPLDAPRRELADAVRATGREVVSAYVMSPTVGASSWLAHLSLLSGVEVRDQYAYTALMASDRETLVTAFARGGYRTVALMPGMRQPWPEGAFYGFDTIYGRTALEYHGPEFGWWSIPDQFALARLDERERQDGPRAPLFAVFPTSTGHAPFGPVPPYQPAWSRLLTSTAFDDDDVARAMDARPDLTNLRPSYVRAMAYEYRALGSYLRAHADDDLLLVALGDHQPPAAVSGPDVPWSVPVHVFGKPGPILDALREKGFRDGLEPRRPELGPMNRLTSDLLRIFDGPVSDPAGGPARPHRVQTTR